MGCFGVTYTPMVRLGVASRPLDGTTFGSPLGAPLRVPVKLSLGIRLRIPFRVPEVCYGGGGLGPTVWGLRV